MHKNYITLHFITVFSNGKIYKNLFIHLHISTIGQPLQFIRNKMFNSLKIQLIHQIHISYSSVTTTVMIKLDTLFYTWHLVWKMFSLCSSNPFNLTYILNDRFITSTSPSIGYSIHLSLASINGSISTSMLSFSSD